MPQDILDLITGDRVFMVLRAALLLCVGIVAAILASRLLTRTLRDRFTMHHLQLMRRLVFHGILLLFIASALRELGFNLAVLIGAAGVLTVAIGFASQTSASNLISGLFLIGERPFSVGDTIKVGDTVGDVLSIDALSVKLRTSDNLFVRIPNETLIKTPVTTFTRFPIRRLDIKVSVAYKESIPQVREVLMGVAERNLRCLDNPAPVFVFLGFGESGLDIQFSVWARSASFLELRNSVQIEIKTAFEEAGIEIPFPHRSIHLGEVAGPVPIRIVDERAPPSGTSKE